MLVNKKKIGVAVICILVVAILILWFVKANAQLAPGVYDVQPNGGMVYYSMQEDRQIQIQQRMLMSPEDRCILVAIDYYEIGHTIDKTAKCL